jgi:AraC family transcriptional regulator of adaptative response/methylated-DNA-[protein]-cysteine methyltransferase
MDTTTTAPTLTLTLDEMRRAYLASDPAYRGLFVLGVKTTGIFCHPTCRARKPRPENVVFFRTTAEALAAGFRACKRCRPLDTDDAPKWATGLIRWLELEPSRRITEQDLRDRGIDPATARRYFQKRFGMTFQAFARSRRLTRAQDAIRDGGDLSMAGLASGYESLSGFREAFGKGFGTTPGQAREAPGCVRLTWIATPLGPMVAGSVDGGVCLLEFSDRQRIEAQLADVAQRFGSRAMPGTSEHLERLETELSAYFEGELRQFTVPVVEPGTPFQTRVWDELRRIPYGETRSYEQIATAIGSPAAVRAVGLANGRNRIAIVVPCHRVVRKGGALGGYAGGLRRKQFLLDLERGHNRSGGRLF